MNQEPYNGKIKINPFSVRQRIQGRIVAVMDVELCDRGLKLICPISRALKIHDIHEIILTDEDCGPGSVVNRVAYIGFVEVTKGGVMVIGDIVAAGNRLLGKIAGFDETHFPNHLNIVVRADELFTGKDLNLYVGCPITIQEKPLL